MAGPSYGGILLTGGASTRFGSDKSLIEIEGEPLAARLGRLLATATAAAVEVGPGRSGLRSLTEDPPGRGPLPALLAGWGALRDARAGDALEGALVLSCDLPLFDETACRRLLFAPPGRSVVPVLGGRPQLLAARWSSACLERAHDLAASAPGRSPPAATLLGYGPVLFLHGPALGGTSACDALSDADTPADLERLLAQVDRAAER